MGKLFAVVLTIITVVSAGLIAAHVWWLPVDISTIGPRIDRQMDETMVATGILFLSSQLILACVVWKFGDKRDGGKIKYFPGGSGPLIGFAIALVGIEILVLSFVGSKVRRKRTKSHPSSGLMLSAKEGMASHPRPVMKIR
ncbi:MAG: hypothetical protein DMG40_00710 [Acidobacteria bacterium]|nr:MAG: hypothetical protein DMG40_00710 [Acidobacteriota bacterium]